MSDRRSAVVDPAGGAGGKRPAGLAGRVAARDRRAVARLISLIENEAPGIERELTRIAPFTGRAHVVGVTGPAGSGKSTLVWRLAGELRARGRTLGIVAVDPTSPFTGGAVLGDRVRMQDLTPDPGIFIRSMASRGSLGGIARATADAIAVLDAYGCEVVLVETVGAGQDEVDIARAAHTTVVVQVPGSGDEIQAIKAGILEIGDVFVVNKADRVRADITVSELHAMLEMGTRPGAWMPPIVKTIATRGIGTAELADAVERHLAHLKASGELDGRLRETAKRRLLEAARGSFLEALEGELAGRVDEMVLDIVERRLDARSAANQLIREFRGAHGATGDPNTPTEGDDGEGAG